MACNNPSLLIIPGSFSNPDLYFTVQDGVAAHGLDVQTLGLPSVRLSPNDTRTPPSMYDDAAMIAREVEKLADQGKDVIVISHSYGGIPMSQAAAGLGKDSRREQGKPGGIVKLAYMTSLVPAIGQSGLTTAGNTSTEPQAELDFDEQGWLSMANLTEAAELAFTDLPLEQGIYWAGHFYGHSAQSFQDMATQTGYTEPGVTLEYLFCEHDRTIPPSTQTYQIQKLEEISGKSVAVTRVAADHALTISAPEKVIEWVVGLAYKKL